jgi:hypothetical protein
MLDIPETLVPQSYQQQFSSPHHLTLSHGLYKQAAGGLSSLFRSCENAELLIQCVKIATKRGISLIILPLMRILGALQTHNTDTFLFISQAKNVPLFKFRCNIFIGVRIIKEMPGLVASGTLCICTHFTINFEGIISHKERACTCCSTKNR